MAITKEAVIEKIEVVIQLECTSCHRYSHQRRWN
jgi:hypothetical protein